MREEIRRGSFNDLGEHPRVIEERENKRRDEVFVFRNERLLGRPEFMISNGLKLMLARMRD